MKSLSFFILVSISLLTTQAQTTAPANEKELKRQRQLAMAVSLIEQTAAEAALWDEKKSAVEVFAAAADLLWDSNPSRAAKWLTQAWEMIDQIAEGELNPAFKEFMRVSDRTQLKSQVLRVANSHDPKLADKFVIQLSEKEPDEKKDRGAFDDRTARSEQLLKLAGQAVETNPQLAFNLAQRSLTDGVSFTLQDVLTSLRKKDVELSNRLFDLALTRFTSGTPEPSEAEVLAGYLFQPGLTFSSNSAGQVIMVMNPMQRNETAVFNSEPQRARGFLVAAYQVFFTRALSIETPEQKQRAQKVWVFGNRNAGRYDTIAPEFSVPMKAFLAQLESKLFPAGRGNPFGNSRQQRDETTSRTNSEITEDRVATLEKRAEKTTDPAARDLAYIEAAIATDAQNYQRAKGLAKKVADEALKADAVSFVIYRAALSFVREKDQEKAVELMPQITNATRRAVVRIALAQSLLTRREVTLGDAAETKVEEQRAFDLLNELERELRKEEPSSNISRIMMGRGALLAKLHHTEALIALQQALQSINKLERFDLKDNSAPKLGIKGSPRSESLADAPRVGFSLRSAIEPLISSEFENIANLADSLKVREVRGVARVEIARLFLEKNKN
ncbi:MAG TPA: hypothetical protein VF074_10065 [Pyrinomonadaceae bacterium]